MTATVDLAQTRQCHCLAARRYAREITRLYEAYLRPHNLRATQFSILAVLSQKGPSRVGELADILGLERTSLSRSARVMLRNGWIAEGHSDDARERPLHITESGRDKIENAFPAWKAAQDIIDGKAGPGTAENHPAPGNAPHERETQ